VKRGEVFWARLDPVEGSEQGGRRPVVIVSRDALNQFGPNVIVLPLSSLGNFSKIYPSQLVVTSRDLGLRGDGVVMAEQIRTISKQRLDGFVSQLSPEIMKKIDEILKVALALKD
jgi:mRNA interferase MazF